MSSLAPIPTLYHGVVFRSRTEARWACFFDLIGLRWEYEPEGFRLSDGTLYLPDFWLPDMATWVEVKPEHGPTGEERRKAELLVEGTHRPCLMLNGSPWPAVFEKCYPSGAGLGEWMTVCFADKYTMRPYHDDKPRMYVCPQPDEPSENWRAVAAMELARQADLRDPDAASYLPVGLEGVGVPW